MFIDYLINNLLRSVYYDRVLDFTFSFYTCKDIEFSGHKENVVYFSPTILSDEDLEKFGYYSL